MAGTVAGLEWGALAEFGSTATAAQLNSEGPAPTVPADAASQSADAAERVFIYGMNYAPEMAGVGRYTGEIAEYLAKLGADVTVVTTPPHYPGWKIQKGYRNRYSAASENGVRVLRTPLLLREKMGGVWRLISPLTFALSSAPVAIWQILRHRPTIVLCIEPTLLVAPAALLAAKWVGARTVLHVQDLEVDAAFATGHLSGRRWLKSLGGIFERACLKRIDRLITISDTMADKLSEKGVVDERIAVVRNWVDLDKIFPLDGPSPYRSELGYQAEDFVVLYSGNIGPKQGMNFLLDAAAELSATAPHIKFVIAGEGPSKPGLERDYGHLANVRFMPFQPYERLNEFLNLADLHALPQAPGIADLVLPSKLGGMLASGKPILAMADPGSELDRFLGEEYHPLHEGKSWAASLHDACATRRRAPFDQRTLAKQIDKSAGMAAWRDAAISVRAGP